MRPKKLDDNDYRRKGRHDAEAVLADLIERGDFEAVTDLLKAVGRSIHHPRLPSSAGRHYLAGVVGACGDLLDEIGGKR